jgi:hypothetical protein
VSPITRALLGLVGWLLLLCLVLALLAIWIEGALSLWNQ